MKISALKPKQRVLLSFFLLAMAVFALYVTNRKPGGWWEGGACSFTLIEHGGFGPGLQAVFISNTPNVTNQPFPPGIHYVVTGKAADEIILILNRCDVWQWGNESKVPKQDAATCTAILAYEGKTNQWSWYPNSQTHADESTFARIMRNLGKYGTPNTPDMQKQFGDIWQVMQTHTNDVIKVR